MVRRMGMRVRRRRSEWVVDGFIDKPIYIYIR